MPARTIKQRLDALERTGAPTDERNAIMNKALREWCEDMIEDGTAPSVDEMREYIEALPENYHELSAADQVKAMPRNTIEDYRKMIVFMALEASAIDPEADE